MAEPHEIIEEIERLAVHCRPPLMSVEDQARWKLDWCSDLAPHPIEAIRSACQRWRNGNDRKFPMPGQLRPLIAAAMQSAQRGPVEGTEAWGPVSDAEYDRMSLRDKIRHQRILGAEANRKAGPMFKGGRHLTADEMPESWSIWRSRAEGHYAEAKRLTAFLKSGEDAA